MENCWFLFILCQKLDSFWTENRNISTCYSVRVWQSTLVLITSMSGLRRTSSWYIFHSASHHSYQACIYPCALFVLCTRKRTSALFFADLKSSIALVTRYKLRVVPTVMFKGSGQHHYFNIYPHAVHMITPMKNFKNNLVIKNKCSLKHWNCWNCWGLSITQ